MEESTKKKWSSKRLFKVIKMSLLIVLYLGVLIGGIILIPIYSNYKLRSSIISPVTHQKLTRDQVQTIIDNTPEGVDKIDVLSELTKRGYEMEGVDTQVAREYIINRELANKDPAPNYRTIFIITYLSITFVIVCGIKLRSYFKKESRSKELKSSLKILLLAFGISIILFTVGSWIAGLAATTIIIILLILILLK